MDPERPRLQPLVRRRLASLGEEGAAWVEALPSLLAGVAEQWDLSLGRPLPGGSASFVTSALTADGRSLVLKVALPGHPVDDEARLLRAAQGRGYVLLHDHDPDRDVLLLERLGRSLEQVRLEPEAKLDALVDTLREAWTVRLPGALDPSVPPGAAQAAILREMVLEVDERFPDACRPDVLALALEYADRRAADPDAPQVVVHGDPHPANALRNDPAREGAGAGWCFVDPDGFGCDPAYDLGVLLREWHARLEGLSPEDMRTRLRGWCERVAERSGLGGSVATRTWEWAFLERVSTGLYVTGFGAHELGARFLASAARLLD